MCQRNKIILRLLPFALCAGLFSCSRNDHLVDFAYGYGTTWDIHLYEGTLEDLEEIKDYIMDTSRLLDLEAKNVPNGVYALNHQGTIEADPFVMEAYLLAESVRKQLPEGYSYTLGALSSAWAESLEKGEVLDAETVGDLLEKSRQTTVTFISSTITKTGEGIVDFGSLGKGLCLRRIQDMLKRKNITKYLINAGTSSLLFGSNSSEKGTTKVHLRDAPGYYFEARDCSVSTSSTVQDRGDDQKNYVIDGVTYSHIIDPRSGMAHVDYQACCLKGWDPAALDAYSTAFMVLGEEVGKTFEDRNIQVAFVKEGKISYASEGFLQKE